MNLIETDITFQSSVMVQGRGWKVDFQLTSNIYFSLCPLTFGEEGFRFLEVVLVSKEQEITPNGEAKAI